MDGHAGHPLAVGHQLLGELLLEEVVDADVALRGHEEIGPDGVEEDALHQAFALAEGILAPALAGLVDQHLHVAVVGHNGGEVIALPVPGHLLQGLRAVGRSQTHGIIEWGIGMVLRECRIVEWVGLERTLKIREPWDGWVGKDLKDSRAMEWLSCVGLGWEGP